MKDVTAHHGLTLHSLRGFSLCLVSSPRLCVMFFVFLSFYFLLYFKDLFNGYFIWQDSSKEGRESRERYTVKERGLKPQTDVLPVLFWRVFPHLASISLILSLSAVFTLSVFVKLSLCLPSRPVSLFFFSLPAPYFRSDPLCSVSCLHCVACCYLSGVFKVPFPSSLQRH